MATSRFVKTENISLGKHSESDLKTINTKNSFKDNSFVSIEQLTKEGVEILLERAGEIKENPTKFAKLAEGKILYSIFWAQSTRTRISTETAWLKLGGKQISVVGVGDSSIVKGETLDHTLRMYTGYNPDFIAIRSHVEKIPLYGALNFSHVSWVNCGDGSNEHPTQGVLDTFTLKEKFEDLSKLKIAFVGDIKHGRTIKSLVRILKMFGSEMSFVAPESLHAKEEIEKMGVAYKSYDINEIEKVAQEVDVVYATRPQLERMSEEDKKLYENGVYQLNKESLKGSKALIMHPLPIDNYSRPEISPDLDNDPRAIYFQEASNGLYARMAIFSLLLGF
jgi:aspartate carbamoyltransferase catalytic subunit